MAECFSRSKTACERVSPREMVKALEYFNVPASMWPAGLLCAVMRSDKLDGLADRIMGQVQADVRAASRHQDEVGLVASSEPTIFKYCVHQEAAKRGATSKIACQLLTAAYCFKSHHVFPAALQQRLVSVGKASFLTIVFNDNYNGEEPYSTRSWAFTVRMPTL